QSGAVSQTVSGLVANMGALPSVENTTQFNINWFGTAAPGWAVTNYTVFISDNFAPYTALLTNTSSTSYAFTGVVNHTYLFFVVANGTDNNSNAVSSAPSPTTTTTLRGPVTDLTVTNLTPTPTGFTVTFSKPVLNTTSNPVHLYSAVASNA